MQDIQRGSITYRFMEMIWENQPIRSTELIRMAGEAFHWKKPTTYTVLRRLIEKELVSNEKSVVTAPVTKDEFLAAQSERFVEENFGGSLPMFLVAFNMCHKLSEEDLKALRKLIDEAEV
ncbi:MAG: BlaI/MecI/CopY family transcriptional regulator [Clostridia bacterium]|nr:BlaI/MecI/CopY family transcriptional regulator [Clostridia bacterium]